MQLSSGLIDSITEARATVRVRVGTQEAEGRGAIYLSDLWAWPDHNLSHEERDATLRQKCVELARGVAELVGAPAHPLEFGLRLHDAVCSGHNGPPALARALCVAPFDAAIHDAAGYATGKSAFAFYDSAASIPSADPLFPREGACRAIKQTLRPPVKALTGWLVVNAHDGLDREFGETIDRHGFSCFKIKLLGKSTDEDVERTVSVYRAALRHGVAAPQLSLDSNEAHQSAEAVLEYLQQLRETDSAAFSSVAYLEQPTSRDIRGHGFDWGNVTSLKPVLLDEGLSHLDLLPLVIQQGWSGLALKTCKGHSFALVAAAWAHRHGLRLAMQDLTNPGLAAIHSWLFAAHLSGLDGIELNSPQFTPQANQPWLPRLAGLFEVRGGLHRLDPDVPGLGSRL